VCDARTEDSVGLKIGENVPSHKVKVTFYVLLSLDDSGASILVASEKVINLQM
jgi:hypothetical protein